MNYLKVLWWVALFTYRISVKVRYEEVLQATASQTVMFIQITQTPCKNVDSDSVAYGGAESCLWWLRLNVEDELLWGSWSIHLLPKCPWHFSSCCSSAEPQSKWVSEQVSLCMGLEEKRLGLQKSSVSFIALTAFHRQCYGDFSSQLWKPELRSPGWG